MACHSPSLWPFSATFPPPRPAPGPRSCGRGSGAGWGPPTRDPPCPGQPRGSSRHRGAPPGAGTTLRMRPSPPARTAASSCACVSLTRRRPLGLVRVRLPAHKALLPAQARCSPLGRRRQGQDGGFLCVPGGVRGRAGLAVGSSPLREFTAAGGGGQRRGGPGKPGKGSGAVGLPGLACRSAGKVTGTRRPVRGGRRSPWKPPCLRGLPGACCSPSSFAPVRGFDRFMGLFPGVFDQLETSGAAEGFQFAG